MLTVLELSLWLCVYGFFCGAAESILGKEKVLPMSWLVTLPAEIGKLFVVTRGWNKNKPSGAEPKTLLEQDG